MRRFLCILAIAAVPACADVTVRMKMEMKAGGTAVLPPQLAEQMKSQMPGDMVTRVKGTRCYTEASSMIYIGDSGKKEILVIDPVRKRYANTTSDLYLKAVEGAMPKMPANASELMGQFKSTSSVRSTGRTVTIQGIMAEEREMTLSMDAPPGQNLPAGPFMKLVLQFWTAQAGEEDRVPALREMKLYSEWAMGEMSPVAAMTKTMGQLPGFGESFGKLMEEMMASRRMILRVHGDIFMPALAAMMKNMPPGANPFGDNLDPEAPLMQMNQEVSEISTASIPDSVFAVPAGYQQAEMSEILKNVMNRMQMPVQQRP